MKNKKTLVSIVSVFMALLMVFVNLSLPVGATSENLNADSTVQAPVNPEDKIDSALKEKMATASPDEKIPVAIWYTDVDQEQIDTLTTQKVGYSQDDIAVDYEMPSTALLSDLKDGKEGADAEMQAYMERTEQQREKERKRTDDYIMTRREFSRTKYNEKSAKIIKDVAINEEDIIFKSQYAPMVITELTIAQIENLKLNPVIESIGFYEECETIPDSLDIALEVSQINKVKTESGLNLSGYGVKVGIIENTSVFISTQEQDELYMVPDVYPPEVRMTSNGIDMTDYGNIVVVGDTTYDPEYKHREHPNVVAEVLLSVAPDVILYSSNTGFNNIEAMITDGVQLLSCSVGSGVLETSLNYGYTTWEKWFDHLVAEHNIVLTKSAGNNGKNIHDSTYDEVNEDGELVTKQAYGPRNTSPGMAYNVITVGAYCETTTPNTLYNYSSYQNSITREDGTIITGCAKPDVIAPATFKSGGTSCATPFLAGMIALMYQFKPVIAAYPQAVKAIVLASCHDKVTQESDCGIQETLQQGITDRQGAGAPNAWTMMAIVSQGTYGIGLINPSDTQITIRFTQPNYGASNMNISLTWLKDNSYNEGYSHTNSSFINEGKTTNLDMYVFCNGNLLKSSTLTNSSTEMTYFNLNSTQFDYEVRVNKVNTNTKAVRYGYAYSTDNMLMASETNEGVYRLKNLETGTYLTLDNLTKELKLASYMGSSLQEWIIKESNAYQISSAYGTIPGMVNHSSVTFNNTNYKAILENNVRNFSMLNWYNNSMHGNKGGVVFYSYIGGTQIYLSYYDDYVTLSSGTQDLADANIWILEKINYFRGDANADGKYNVNDATLIQKYLVGTVTLNNLQLFLADADYDGTVNAKDVTKIQQDLV